jgi:uncharacterized protein YegP (UPF0339 family)
LTKPSFEIHKDELGKFRFRVRSNDNKIVTIGEGCNTRDCCINGIMEVKETIKEYHDSKIRDFTIGETILILNKPKKKVRKGSIITFNGKLIGNVTGNGIDNARIRIYESDGAILKEKPIVECNTNILGDFSIDWIAKKMDWWDNSIEIYAKFEGVGSKKPSFSEKQTILLS